MGGATGELLRDADASANRLSRNRRRTTRPPLKPLIASARESMASMSK